MGAMILALSGCGKKEITYDDIMDNILDSTIYTSSSSTAITANGNLAFKDMTPAVVEDLNNAKNTYGIDLTFGVDGQLDIMMVSSVVSDGKISYTNNFNTQNFSSSQQAVADMINGYLGSHTSTSEAYVDLTTGEAMAKVDGDEDWTTIPAGTGLDNSLLTSSELKPLIGIVADTVGHDKAVITATENGYTLEYDFALNNEILSQVPQNYRDMIEANGISYDNILSVVQTMDTGSYSFPVHLKLNLLKQGKNYMINDVSFSGTMYTGFDKSWDELLALGLGSHNPDSMPKDYEFGITGEVSLAIEYKNNFGYQPTQIFDEDVQQQVIQVQPVN